MLPASEAKKADKQQLLTAEDPGQQASRYRITVYGIAAVILVTSVWISLTRFECLQNADSIVPVLVSLQRWTPFFWATNRYGMLIPLLAIPFQNPLTNLLVQTALGVAAGLACSFFLIRYFFKDSAFWWIAAALQNVWLLLLVPRQTQFDWLVVQCYGTCFSLAFAALISAGHRRYVLAVLLMFLSHWMNVAAFVFLVPLILQRHWIDREKRGLFTSLAVVAAGAAGGFALMFTAQSQTTQSGFTPVSAWIPAWQEMIRLAHIAALKEPVLGWWIFLPAGLGLVASLFVRSARRALLVCMAFTTTAVLYGLFTGTLVWVRANLYVARYVYPSILLFSLVAAILIIAPFENRLRQHSILALASAGLMLVAAVTTFGKASRSAVRQDLAQRFGSMTNEILSSQATVLSGDYWTVWPAVFEANLTLRERGEHRRVYGLTYRALESSIRWSHHPGLCIDAPMNDHDAKGYMKDTGRHFQLVQQFSTIAEYCED